MGDMGGIIGMGGGLVDTLNPGDEWGHRSAGGAAASGALKGAAMGAPLGPIGMGVGALIGGVSSFFGQKKQNKKADMAKWRHQSSARMEARNYGQQDMANFAEEGGKLTQLYPRFMQPTKNGMQTIKYYLDGGNLMEEFGPQSIQPGWTHEYFERPSEFNMRPGYQQFKSGGFGAVFRGGSSPGYMASQGGNHNQGHFGDTAGGGRANMLFLTRDPKTNIWAKQAAPGDFQRKWGYQGFKQGGKKVPGGEVNQLSDRAVEFEGNNPQATDAINIGDNTFVDHNEAMVQTPEGEIVASDSVFLGGGKRSVASHVKSLQSRKSKSRSPEKRGFYDYRTDVALAQQELEAGRVDPKQVLAIAEPGGEQMRHGGIGDKDPNFHPPTADSINFAGGGSVFGDGRDENFLNADFSKRPGSQMYYEYGGLYAGNNPVDETEFFNLQNLPDQRKKKRKLNLKDGGLVMNDDIMGRVAQYCKGGRYARKMNEGGKMEDDDDYLDKLAENKSEAMEEQLEMGIPTEAKEHKTSMKKGRRLAKDHLEED
ncbi:MAG: hypothetical protein JSW41_05945 [Candidatus Aenigmatarchaeota archaeon]|nr:MAG: hypothetical protein JSW41_05945 [Candidatus Aenigmarchaeota archaeon]